MSEYALKRHGGNSLEVKFLPMPLYSAPQKLLHSLPVFFCGSGLFHSFGLCSSHAGPPHEVPQPIFVNMFESYKSKGFKVGLGKRQKKQKKPITLNHAGFFPTGRFVWPNHAQSRAITRAIFSKKCVDKLTRAHVCHSTS